MLCLSRSSVMNRADCHVISLPCTLKVPASSCTFPHFRSNQNITTMESSWDHFDEKVKYLWTNVPMTTTFTYKYIPKKKKIHMSCTNQSKAMRCQWKTKVQADVHRLTKLSKFILQSTLGPMQQDEKTPGQLLTGQESADSTTSGASSTSRGPTTKSNKKKKKKKSKA